MSQPIRGREADPGPVWSVYVGGAHRGDLDVAALRREHAGAPDMPVAAEPTRGYLTDDALQARLARSPCQRELDAIIQRAEAACARYRRAAEEPGLAPPVALRRQRMWWKMEGVLTRLRASQDVQAGGSTAAKA